MYFRNIFILFLICKAFTFAAESTDNVREYFEWGEYSKLIKELEPLLSQVSYTVDSAVTAKYYSYSGVAYFGLGNIGKAREQFYKALFYSPGITLDRKYVTEEMINLFAATKIEFFNQRRDALFKDSILIAKQVAYESNLNLMKRDALQRRKRNNSIFALSFAGIGAVFLGIVAFEYYATSEPYRDFKSAALSGDKTTYDRYRPLIKRANGIIIGCEIAGAISLTSATFFSFKTGKLKKELKQP